jgi:hypothetical protein
MLPQRSQRSKMSNRQEPSQIHDILLMIRGQAAPKLTVPSPKDRNRRDNLLITECKQRIRYSSEPLLVQPGRRRRRGWAAEASAATTKGGMDEAQNGDVELVARLVASNEVLHNT